MELPGKLFTDAIAELQVRATRRLLGGSSKDTVKDLPQCRVHLSQELAEAFIVLYQARQGGTVSVGPLKGVLFCRVLNPGDCPPLPVLLVLCVALELADLLLEGGLDGPAVGLQLADSLGSLPARERRVNGFLEAQDVQELDRFADLGLQLG